MSTDRDDAVRPDQHQSNPPDRQPAVDTVEIAERVYRLMRAEVRLERARGVLGRRKSEE